MREVLIGLGANIDDPKNQLLRAASALSETPGLAVTRMSGIYRSSPMGPSDQPDFFNACLHARTSLDALPLLRQLQAIEAAQGRRRTRHWGERCIDLDLLWIANCEVESPELTVPHPGLEHRDFVIRPLIDLMGPKWQLPSGATLSEQLAIVSPRTLAAPYEQQVSISNGRALSS